MTPHLHLVPRSRMCDAIPPFPNTHSWRGAQLKHSNNITLPCSSSTDWLESEKQLTTVPDLGS
jgi:hypothetical protein